MTSDVDVCNMALDLVGQTNIATLQDGTPVSAICVRHFVPTVREILRDGRWKCARISASLTLLAASPGNAALANGNSNVYPQVGGWPPGNTLPVYDGGIGFASPFLDSPPYAWWFQLPVDFIRLVRFNQLDPTLTTDPLFEIQGQVLKTTMNVANIDYVADVTQNASGQPYGINLLDPMLIKALAYALAVKLSWRFQQSKTQMESLKQDAEAYLRKARSIDSRDEREILPNRAAESDWVKSRWISTNA